MLTTMWRVLAAVVLVLPAALPSRQDDAHVQAFVVTADRFVFSPRRIDVRQGDLVRVTLKAVDRPHTIVIDGYRIAKRAAAGRSVVVEFRADRSGTFPFYCNLTNDDRYRQMKGLLVVRQPGGGRESRER